MVVDTISSGEVTAREPSASGAVISKDGTRIGYQRFGQGPGVVLVQGTMGTAAHYRELASALADRFSVFVPDRRGRGMSDPGPSEYSMQKEVDDLDALLKESGAHHVFGLSAGALITLQAVLTLPAIHKAVICEPPLLMDKPPTALLTRYESEMAQGKVPAALITAMKAAKLGPPIFNLMPRKLLEWFTDRGMKAEEKNGSGGYPPMRELAGTIHYDFQLVVEMSGTLERFRGVRSDVLLLNGSKSPAYLKGALDALEQVIPGAKRVVLPGLDHAAAWNHDRGGQPERVASALRDFFSTADV